MAHSLKGNIRVFCRLRPNTESSSGTCLKPISHTQLEVNYPGRGILPNGSAADMRRKSLLPKGPGGSNFQASFRSPRPSNKNLNLGTKSASSLLYHRNNSNLGVGQSDNINKFGSNGQLLEMNPSHSNLRDNSSRDTDPKIFFFDRLFAEDVSEEEVFSAVNEEIRAAMEGHYVSLIAYGATGSGKTHTISNIATRMGTELQNFVYHVLETGEQVQMHMQLLEIYNDSLRDLLATKPTELKIVNENNSVAVSPSVLINLSPENCVGGLNDALQVAKKNRVTHVTNVHERSSRSHMIMTLYIKRLDSSGKKILQAGKLNLVDLAGSERVKKSEATGERLKEAQCINRSLSALADVLWAHERKVAHIPYRNSKLTHLLQDSLGGTTTRTVMFVTCDTKMANTQETLHTLQFGSRLNSVSMNASNTAANRKTLGNCVEQNRLQACLDQEQQKVASEAQRSEALERELVEKDDKNKALKEENLQLQKKVSELARQRTLVAQNGPYNTSSNSPMDTPEDVIKRLEILEQQNAKQQMEIEKLRGENIKLRSSSNTGGSGGNHGNGTTSGSTRFNPAPRGVKSARAASAGGVYDNSGVNIARTSPRTAKRSPLTARSPTRNSNVPASASYMRPTQSRERQLGPNNNVNLRGSPQSAGPPQNRNNLNNTAGNNNMNRTRVKGSSPIVPGLPDGRINNSQRRTPVNSLTEDANSQQQPFSVAAAAAAATNNTSNRFQFSVGPGVGGNSKFVPYGSQSGNSNSNSNSTVKPESQSQPRLSFSTHQQFNSNPSITQSASLNQPLLNVGGKHGPSIHGHIQNGINGNTTVFQTAPNLKPNLTIMNNSVTQSQSYSSQPLPSTMTEIPLRNGVSVISPRTQLEHQHAARSISQNQRNTPKNATGFNTNRGNFHQGGPHNTPNLIWVLLWSRVFGFHQIAGL